MSDEFLYQQLSAPPPRELARALYAKIDRPVKTPVRVLFLRRLALGFTALLLALALTLAVSPGARAYLAAFVREIGGLSFEESDLYPGGGGPVHTVPTEIISFADVQAGLPFPIGLPAWVPDGMIPREDVSVTLFSDEFTPVEISWGNGQAGFAMTVMQPVSVYVGRGSIEEVLVDGRPAALIRGGWDYDRQEWNDSLALTLEWELGDHIYRLETATLDAATLIRIAESIQAP
jgi:hypothetical protein